MKKGKWVDNEEDESAWPRERRSERREEIPDRRPVDLKTLFPKLSLF